MTLKDKEVIMKVTVKEGLHVPALAVAPNKKRRNGVRRYISWRGFFVPALAVAPNKKTAEQRPPVLRTASSDYTSYSKPIKSLKSLQSFLIQSY